MICEERYTIVVLDSIAFVNVYLPCESNVNSNNYLDVANNMIDEISAHLITLAPDYILFGGDLNTDLRINSRVTGVICSFAGELDLIESSSVATLPIDYTFHSISTGHRSS